MVQVNWGRLGAATLLTLAAAMPGVAGAQNTAGDDPNAFGTAGSVAQDKGFSIRGSVRTLYDENILRLGNGLQPRNGASRSDFRFSPLVAVAYGQPIGRQSVFIGADVGRDIYAKNNQLNRNRYSFGGGLNWRLARSCSGSITGDYKRRQSLLSEQSGSSDNTQEVQNYSASADCAPSAGLGFGGNVSRSVTDNQNPSRQAFDSRDTNFGAHLNFGAPGLGQFSAGGNYSRILYPRRTLFVAAPNNGIAEIDDRLNLYSGNLGYSRSLGARLSISASVSYIRVKPDPETVLQLIQIFPGGPTASFPNARAGYSGPGYSLSLDYHPGVRLGATVNATRNVTSSSSVGAQFVIRDSFETVVTYNFGPSITSAIGATYDRRQYKGGFATTEEPLARNRDSIARVFARASYAPRTLYGIDFELAHQKRSSNPSIYNFSSTSASVTLRVKFGRG